MPVAHGDLHVHEWRFRVLPKGLTLGLRQLRHDRGDHHVIAGEHATGCACHPELAAVHVAHVDPAVAVPHAYGRALQPQPRRRAGIVETPVIEGCGHDVVHRRPRCDRGDQRPDHQPRERRVPVGEVVDVRLVHLGGRDGVDRQPHPREPRVARLVRVVRRDAVDPHREEVVGPALERVGRFVVQPPVPLDVVPVARGREQRERLVLRHTLERVPRRGEEVDQGRLRGVGHGEVGDERSRRPLVHAIDRDVVGDHPHRIAGDERVAPERLA